MQIEVRQADLRDADILSRISGDWFRLQFDGTCTRQDMEDYIAHTFTLENIHAQLENEDYTYLVMTIDGIIQAYALLYDPKGIYPIPMLMRVKAVELKRFYLHSSLHGKGLSNDFMKAVMNKAIDNGFDSMYLSVWEYNIRAQSFYLKQGFVNSQVSNPFPIGNTAQTDVWFFRLL